MSRIFPLWLAVAIASPVSAQQDSSLIAAVRLATEGRSDSARAMVRAKLRALSPADSALPEVLYVAGIVAASPDSTLYYLRRVSIEHPRSDWADQALLRMAQLAFAAGDYAGARRAAERVVMDYPFADVRADAGFWAARALFELGDAAEGCRILARAESEAGENLELLNRIRYHLQRCAVAVDSVAGDTAAPGTVMYAVQVAAVQSAVAADELMRQLAARGYQARVRREPDGLFRVRVGRFANRADAQRLASDIRSVVGGSPFVVEER